MALLDRIKFDGSSDVLVWKYPKDNIVLGSQLIVNQSQEAVFFKDGRALDTFGPGAHMLSTMNIPLLQSLLNLPFGGKTPFAAEIYFVNRVSKLDYKWGTRTPIPVEDPKYRVLISVGPFGQFGLKVQDSRKFVTKIVGTMSTWDGNKVSDYFRGLVLTSVKDNIAKFLVQKGISVVELTSYLEELSKVIEDAVRDNFGQFGLGILNFFITSISIPDDEIKQIQKGQFERFEIDQLGDERYQRKRSLDVMEAAASNPGAPGTLMAGGLGLGMGAQMMANVTNMSQQASQIAQPMQSMLDCPKCNAKSPTGSKFCAQCGTGLGSTICPSCGAAISVNSKFCIQCGKTLTSTKCPDCGTYNEVLARFCSKCGHNLQSSKT